MRLVNRHRQHLGNVAAIPFNFQRLRVVAAAMASGTWRINAGHEQQFDMDKTLALAGLAAALGHVERETARAVSAGLGHSGRGEEFTDVVEQARVGCQIGARRAADGLLVHVHQPLDGIGAGVDAACRARQHVRRSVQPAPG
ncbi:hypothetical protein G6F57_018308 [Rhizopus arrhizus]|nr:hypothetical protein G6F57_018308 [Rhizopus arrhizus]